LTSLADNISTRFKSAPDSGIAVGLDVVRSLYSGLGSERISISQVGLTRKPPSFTNNVVGVRIAPAKVFNLGVAALAARQSDNDSLAVTVLGTDSIGIDVQADASLLTGAGDDSVSATAEKTVLGVAGTAVDFAGLGGVGIRNAGSIQLEAGNDSMLADGSWRGLYNMDGKTIDFGRGTDRLDGYGEITNLEGRSAGIYNGIFLSFAWVALNRRKIY
jgi:hypothetical protein